MSILLFGWGVRALTEKDLFRSPISSALVVHAFVDLLRAVTHSLNANQRLRGLPLAIFDPSILCARFHVSRRSRWLRAPLPPSFLAERFFVVVARSIGQEIG